MSANAAVAATLDEMAKLMELLGEDSFRVSAHSRAARTIADLPQDVSALDRKQLLEIQGIGAKIADKIVEFVSTGKVHEHEELRAKVPAGLMELLAIPGMGPKTARMLWQEGGITDRAGLARIIDDGSILKLPRMGEKAVAKLKESMAFAQTTTQRLPLGLAAEVADRIIARLRVLPGVERIEAAGSLRRGRDSVGDIDIMVAVKSIEADSTPKISKVFREMTEVRQILTAGDTRSSCMILINPELGRWSSGEAQEPKGPAVQVDLRILPLASWGAAMMYFTGSKDHNIAMRKRALERGLTLTEYGLFPKDDDPTPPHQRGVKSRPAENEEILFKALDLPWIPPEIRESHGELDLSDTPKLIEIDDIKAELHAHTKASDGSMTIEELAEEAKRRGFHTIAVTDHSKSSAQANGLSVDRLLAHIDAIHAARAKVKGITILAGSEVDILADGTLDYDDATLAKLDVVIASPHTALSQEPATATKRLLKAIAHPCVHILGHPTGRLINRRPGLSPDMAGLIAAAKEHAVALEINAHWLRLDLRDAHVKAAVDAGALISINCDTHDKPDMENLRFGIATARRGWLTPDLCINCWPAQKLHDWLKAKR